MFRVKDDAGGSVSLDEIEPVYLDHRHLPVSQESSTAEL